MALPASAANIKEVGGYAIGVFGGRRVKSAGGKGGAALHFAHHLRRCRDIIPPG